MLGNTIPCKSGRTFNSSLRAQKIRTADNISMRHMINGAELGGATGAMAPLVFWSRIKKSRKVSKSKSHTL